MDTMRSSAENIASLHGTLKQDASFSTVFAQLPDMALVLNGDRQIVYGNQKLLKNLGMTNIRDALSRRPGELMRCVNAAMATGCGDAEGCRYCKALAAIQESQESNETVTKNARVTVQPADKAIALDLKVTATPLALDSLALTMVFLSDISDQKRREYLEEVFLHDARNTLNVLSLMSDVIDLKQMPDDLREDFSSIQRYVAMLAEDIDGHQMLRQAEQGTLQPRLSAVHTLDVVSDCLETVSQLAHAANIRVDFEDEQAPEHLMTDRRLARRVIVNALKNAIEATPRGGRVSLKVSGEQACVFAIQNPGHLADATREQIFQRSFSTKGPGRGLGTYSMRLLLETYLNGQVSFSSDAEEGTTFSLMFPVCS